MKIAFPLFALVLVALGTNQASSDISRQLDQQKLIRIIEPPIWSVTRIAGNDDWSFDPWKELYNFCVQPHKKPASFTEGGQAKTSCHATPSAFVGTHVGLSYINRRIDVTVEGFTTTDDLCYRYDSVRRIQLDGWMKCDDEAVPPLQVKAVVVARFTMITKATYWTKEKVDDFFKEFSWANREELKGIREGEMESYSITVSPLPIKYEFPLNSASK